MQEQQQKNSISKSAKDWQDSVSFVRHQTEDRIADGIIKNVNLDDNIAYITVQPIGLDETVTCSLDAEVQLENKSPFEKFLDDQGYNPTEQDLLNSIEDEKCKLRVTDSSQELEFDMYIEEPKSESQINHHEEIKRDGFSILLGYIVGSIPIMNFVYLYIETAQIFKRENIREDIDEQNFYFVVGVATSILLVYGLAVPILLI